MEMVIYISILTLVTAALISVVISVLSTFGKLKGYEEVAYTGTVVLERMSREIRRAGSIDTVMSSFGTNPSSLSLVTTDLSDNPTTVRFSVAGGRVMIQEGVAAAVPLSNNRVSISDFTLTRIIGTNSDGVLIELTLERTISNGTTTKQFRSFVVLDG